MSYINSPVGKTFSFRFEYRGKPVEGLPIRLSGAQQSTLVTGADGTLRLSELPAGTYYLSPLQDTGFGNEFVVDATGPDRSMTLTWPAKAPIAVRTIAGVITLPGVPMDLTEGVTGRRLASTNADSLGRFQFDSVPPGLYFLQLPQIGVIPAELSQAAPSASLDIEALVSSCGLSFTDRSQCSIKNLEVSSFQGLVDGSLQLRAGRWEHTRVEIELRGADGMVYRTESDEKGEFGLPNLPPGTYELTMVEPGDTTLHANLIVDPAVTLARIQAKFRSLGTCSDAWAGR